MKHTVWRVFLPQAYSKEAETVNARSAEGFHLTGFGPFSRTEEEIPGVRWHYALDCRTKDGLTELLYKKQGWERVCASGAWVWFRKQVTPERQESEYVLHGADENRVEAQLRRIIRRLDLLRNLLLIAAFLLILIPGSVTANWTPRIAAAPLLLCIPVVKYAEAIRKTLGEEYRK